MSDTALQAKTIMKDGKWCVPPDQRPRGWESMGVAEQEAPEVSKESPLEAVMEETQQRSTHRPRELTVEPEPQPEPKVMEFVIGEAPDLEDFIEMEISCWGEPEKEKDLYDKLETNGVDVFGDLLPFLGEKIYYYREAKKRTNRLLTNWAERFKTQLRTLGLMSKPVKALAEEVQRLMWDKLRLERHLEQVAKQIEGDDPCGAETIRALLAETRDGKRVYSEQIKAARTAGITGKSEA